MPMREIASDPGFTPLADGIEDAGVGELRRARFTQLRQGIVYVHTKVRPYYKTMFLCGALCGTIFAVASIISLVRESQSADDLICGGRKENAHDVQHYTKEAGNMVGVNLGGWLCLEDWFFSGSVGRYVSTPGQDYQGQGACLPPLVPGPMEKPWNSEGELVERLARESSRDFAAKAMKAHRESFITGNDFRDIASLGIQTVRIPLTWSLFADALSKVDHETYGKHNPDTDTVIVPDPYYVKEILYATIPRNWLLKQLQLAAVNGLRIILDLHNMPGGASDGTYNGIWPRKPRFWNSKVQLGPKKDRMPLTDVGMMLVDALITWVESLTNILRPGVIRGVCFMNEPGHMGAGSNWTSETQIINYLEAYSDRFRMSDLPALGVRLYVQVIESAFEDFGAVVPNWYNNFYSQTERYSWAVIARHYYMAWSAGGCDGRIIWGGKYRCDEPLEKIRGYLADCSYAFAGQFKADFDGLRAVTEWSMGTYWDADLQCSNSDVLRTSFVEGVRAFAIVNESVALEPIFWSWRIPHAPKFQAAWSLKYFSGFVDEADNSDGGCMVGKWATP